MRDATQALVSGGLADTAERAWSQLTTPTGLPTLVVVGEVKRGKSLLVNALLGRPDASPVDVDIATSAFIRFIPPTGARDDGWEHEADLLYAGGRREKIDLAELAEWVTIAGRHVSDPNADELPLGAEVSMTSRFLPRLGVVDTPGVGGLNRNHLRLAKMASTSASILLMTCDASAPITAAELDFLKAVSAEIDAVLIAVTKIDKNYRHWRAIVDENRRLLSEHAPRFADTPVLGVSSLRALSALAMDPGERRDSALRASGLPQLIEHLEGMCAAGERLSVANGVRAALTGLNGLAAQLETQRSAIVGGEETVAEFSEEEERLQELRRQESTWRDNLTRDLNSVQRVTLESADHQIDELKADWKRRLDHTRLDLLRRRPQAFVADITADLEALLARVSDEYRVGVAKLIEDYSIAPKLTIDDIDTPVRGEDPRTRMHNLFDPQVISLVSVGAGSLSHQLLPHLGLAAGAAMGFLSAPLTLAIGGGWAAVNLAFRAMRNERLNLQQWVNTAATGVTKDVMRAIQERQDAVRPVIINEYKQQITDAIAEVQKLINTAKDAARESSAQREEALAKLDAQRAALDTMAAALQAQLARLASAAPRDPLFH
jgi:Dynamin family